MIQNIDKIVMQVVGDNIYLGGEKQYIEPINFSVYNYGGCNTDLIELSPNFYYFTCDAEGYLKARTRNIWYNWPYENVQGNGYKRIKITYKLSELVAKKELASYRHERFVSPNENNYFSYSFGSLSKDLYKTNSETIEKEIIEFKEDKIKQNVEED